MPVAFVKFSRGLTSIYNSLSVKDPNTLYLVYDANDSLTGKLYLGDKLISGVGNGSSISLNDLADVSITGTLEDGMVLQYNASTSGGSPYWEAVSVADLLAGQSISGDGSDVSIVADLNNISSPSENDIAIVSGNAYVYDGTQWVQLTNTSLADRISALESAVGAPAEGQNAATGLFKDIDDINDALSNVYTKSEIQQYISNLSHLKYEVVASVAAINTTATDAATTIYLVPKSTTGTNDGYDEYFVVNGSLEKIGEWNTDADLSNYVQTTDSRLLTPVQQIKLDAITLDANDNLTITSSQVSDLAQAISDNQFIKSVDVSTFSVDSNGKLELIDIPASVLDLSNYVTYAVVGDLSDIDDRVSANSTLVDEINAIKESIIWNTITAE